jgi:hypothetical protein
VDVLHTDVGQLAAAVVYPPLVSVAGPATLEVSTEEAHEGYIRRAIRPALGEVKICELGADCRLTPPQWIDTVGLPGIVVRQGP